MSTAETIKAQLQADITAANEVTGKTDTTVHDAVNSLIEGFGEAYVAASGALYKKHMELNAIGNTVFPGWQGSGFQGATEMETFYSNYGGLIGAQYLFDGCSKLREVYLPKCTGLWLGNTHTFSDTPSLEKVSIGSIGCPVTRMDAGSFRTPPITLEIFVDATTIAEIPTLITNNVPSAWNVDATVIYRNSTTGEVIIE